MQREDWKLFGLSLVFVALQVWLDLKLPDYMSTITKLVKTDDAVVGKVLAAGGMMILCAFGSAFALILVGYLSARLAANFSRHLRRDVFRRVEDFSMEEIDEFSTASLITRSTNDVQQLQNIVSRGLRMIIQAPITAIMALVKISGRHWEWTAVTGGAVIIVLCTVVFLVLYAHPRFRKMQMLTDDINGTMRDNMTGIRVVRAYNAEEYQEDKFKAANDRLTKNSMQARLAMSVNRPVMQMVNNCLSISIYCIGAFLIAKEPSSEAQLDIFSEMVVFSTYASKLLFSFMSLNMIFNMLPRAAISAGRINEVLETKPRIKDGEETAGVEGKEGEIEFRNVTFRYPGAEQDALSNISFTAKRGETVAFIGATGSGKTTLVNLVPRFYDVTDGQVLVDGRDVREYSQKALRNKLGIATQRAILFTGTVSSNVAYGDNGKGESSREDIEKSVKIAQAEEFVSKMNGTYDADISRGGTNVSGGQKQRLSIARAVNRKPEVYIFDDTFSALDYRTDRTLRGELKTQTAGTTTLIVAQRIGTIRDADKIIVLDEGKIVGMGKHEELLKNCDVYKEIAYTQLSEEELQNG
jgi:ATP-binding cassette subfamily B protein